MFLETDAILLLWALKAWRNYFLRWNFYRGGFLHPDCCSGCAGQPGESQCLSCSCHVPHHVLSCSCHVMFHICSCWGPCSGHCPRLPPTACLGLGCPQGSLRCSLCCFLHQGLWLFYFLLWSSHVLFVLVCLCDTHTPVPVPCDPAGPVCTHWALQGSLISGLVASLPCRKPSNFILELVLKLIAAQSLTAVLISDLKLLDLVTPSSLGRSVFIIIVSKEGLGDY